MMFDTSFLEQQKQALSEEKRRLLDELRAIGRADTRDEENFIPIMEDYGTEQGDEALETEELETRASVEGELEDVLRDTDDALRKIEEGDYGICEDCGREMEKERLKALPQARLCVSCED